MIENFNNIYRINPSWHRIMSCNNAIRPTQSYDYYRYLFFAFYSRFVKVGHWRIVFHYFQDGQNECIIPLVVNCKRMQIRSVSCKVVIR